MILDRITAEQVQLVPARYGRMLVHVNDRYMGQAFLRYGEYSESEVALWRELLTPDAIVADVGANIGAHTVALAKLVPNGLVFAFEPLPHLFHLLAGNVALNGLPNVLTYHAACGKAPGTIRVPAIDYTQQDNYGGIALGGYTLGNPVVQLRLDDVLPRVTLLKADVEGMELDVLLGSERLLRECRPILYLECNPEPDKSLAAPQLALIRHVQQQGYEVRWHCAPLYNPQNLLKAPPLDAYESTVVSYNLLCLPKELGVGMDSPPIEEIP